ncbi:MAG: Cna B-type domain-containing protein [Clostridia bacterium]|nr:Cna B-type domain-containing protein [Clostridia bacterium]
MNCMKKTRHIFAILLVCIMCLTLSAVSTAALPLETTTGRITISLLDDDQNPLEGSVFRLYHIATAVINNDDVQFVYTDTFAGNGMPAGDFSDAYLPVHLTAFATVNNIGYDEQTTDETGTILFDALAYGAYLIVPVKTTQGYMSASPFIVFLPIRDKTTNEWVGDVDASPKVEDDSGEQDTTYISVRKQWKTTDEIPESITVALLRDNAITDTVELNAENNWYHRWNDLDASHTWSVVETAVPQDYTVTYVTSEMTVIIINTHDDYEEPPTPPDEPDNPDEPPTKPGRPPLPPEEPSNPDDLVDTGQLNWPVPVFATIGLLLFGTGWAMFNLGNKDEDEETE